MATKTRGLIITLLLLGSLIAIVALTQTIVLADDAAIPDTPCHNSRSDREACAKNTSKTHHACGSQDTCTKTSELHQCDT
jgi:hypothetical protein